MDHEVEEVSFLPVVTPPQHYGCLGGGGGKSIHNLDESLVNPSVPSCSSFGGLATPTYLPPPPLAHQQHHHSHQLQQPPAPFILHHQTQHLHQVSHLQTPQFHILAPQLAATSQPQNALQPPQHIQALQPSQTPQPPQHHQHNQLNQNQNIPPANQLNQQQHQIHQHVKEKNQNNVEDHDENDEDEPQLYDLQTVQQQSNEKNNLLPQDELLVKYLTQFNPRKRKGNPAMWVRNQQKYLHLHGQKYVNSLGKTVEAKTLKKVDCSSCTFKCNDKVSEENRQTLFNLFYSLNSLERQKDYIASNVREVSTRTEQEADRQEGKQKLRLKVRRYSFTIGGIEHRVCKKFFLATLAIGEKYIDHTLQNSCHGFFLGFKRGGRTPPNKTKNEDLEKVREHIMSFPTIREDTKKETKFFLPGDLNVSKMYKMFQKSFPEGSVPVSKRVYRNVFNEEFNIPFHTHKKDACAACSKYSERKKLMEQVPSTSNGSFSGNATNSS